MIILGISDSHEAHACIVKNGELVSAVAEERITRLKADMGYPRKSIDTVLALENLSPGDIDVVAFAGKRGTPFHALYKINALFSIKDWIKQCYEYWGPILIDGKKMSQWDDFEIFKKIRGDDLYKDPYYDFVRKSFQKKNIDLHKIFNEVRSETVQKHLGINNEKIKFYRHEDCHKLFGLYSYPGDLNEATIITLEGGGDDSSATFSSYKDDKIKEIWSSNLVNLGRLYRYVTLILGMKPAQHEYKVMGLAPYGNKYHGQFSLDFFNSLSEINDYKIVPTNKIKDLYFSIKKALEGERFDGIAWGLQKHLELVLAEWVKNCIKKTSIDNVVISGGVGQNIKAMKYLIDNLKAKSIWAGPICGDGSLGIGAAFLATREFDKNYKLSGLKNIYLGTKYNNEQVDNAIKKSNLDDSFFFLKNPSAQEIAKWLMSGLVCARFSGRMEFGQRALGNRSILADPRDFRTVEKINRKIKYRDFWMPFTPSLTIKQSELFLKNPNKIFSPYMTIAFDLKEDVSERIPAAIHPADKTSRPQMVLEKDNPRYYQILKEFGKITGIECLLNTSFNLHGEAIVETPEQAIQTFLDSEIDILIFDSVAISRVKLDKIQ